MSKIEAIRQGRFKSYSGDMMHPLIGNSGLLRRKASSQ